MATRRRSKIIAAAILAAVVTALGVDRVVLYLWAHQVIELYKSLQTTVAAGGHTPPNAPFGYVSIGLEPLLVMPKSDRWPIRYLTVQTDRVLAQPSAITLDGAGALHLRFLPPRLAWTTWLIPRRDPGQHADPVGVDPRLNYQYRIDIDQSSPEVLVTLTRGPFHFAEPLRTEELHPLLFP